MGGPLGSTGTSTCDVSTVAIAIGRRPSEGDPVMSIC